MNLINGDSSIYYKIQNQSLEIGEKDLAHIFDMARCDPRLMEVATEFVRDFWWNINPVILNRSLKNSKFPYAIKPATAAILKNSEFPDEETYRSFLLWYEAAIAGIKNPKPQLFYIGINKIGSKSMKREEAEAISCFTNFNLIAKDLPFNKGRPGVVKNREIMVRERLSPKENLKSTLAMKIKNYKELHRLTNDEVAKQLRINRVFLSNILNNRLEKISADYLLEKTRNLKAIE